MECPLSLRTATANRLAGRLTWVTLEFVFLTIALAAVPVTAYLLLRLLARDGRCGLVNCGAAPVFVLVVLLVVASVTVATVIDYTGWLPSPIAAQTADDKLIVPGERIGQLRLADLEVVFGKSIYFAAKGIAFTVAVKGLDVGKVAELRIFWKVRAPGDLTVVPGSRISSLALGMTTDQAVATLGGGYIRHTRGPRESYYWPHYGLTMLATNGVAAEVITSWDQQLEDVGVKYSTAQGLGFDSTAEQIRSTFGESAERVRQGDADL